jgi:hypothetical protein
MCIVNLLLIFDGILHGEYVSHLISSQDSKIKCLTIPIVDVYFSLPKEGDIEVRVKVIRGIIKRSYICHIREEGNYGKDDLPHRVIATFLHQPQGTPREYDIVFYPNDGRPDIVTCFNHSLTYNKNKEYGVLEMTPAVDITTKEILRAEDERILIVSPVFARMLSFGKHIDVLRETSHKYNQIYVPYVDSYIDGIVTCLFDDMVTERKSPCKFNYSYEKKERKLCHT